MTSSPKRISVLIFLLACTVRLIAVRLWSDVDVTHADPSEYMALAQNIRLHSVFSFGAPHTWGADAILNSPGPFLPTAARAPLYPLFIASLWWGSEPPVPAVHIMQAVLGALVALLVHLMAFQAFGPRTAVWAGVAMALAPLTILCTANVMSEVLFTFLLTLGLWFWGRKLGLPAGILLGVATLTRAVLLPFLILLAIVAIASKFNRALHARIVLGAALIILPWTIRNTVTQQAFVAINVQGWGSNLLFATIDLPYGSGNPWPLYVADPAVKEILDSSQSESQAENRMVRVAIQKISAHPFRWLWFRAKQYPRLFIDSATYLYRLLPVPSRMIQGTFLLGNVTFLLLSIAGLYLARSEWQRVYHLVLFPVFLAIVQFPVLTDPRYSVPIVPMMMIFAAFGAYRILTHNAERERVPAHRVVGERNGVLAEPG